MKCAALYSHLRPASLYNIFPHYLINGTILEIKVIEPKTGVLIVILLSSETFLILRRTERDMMTYIYIYIGLHVKYPLFVPNFKEIWVFSTDFRKIG
jgi:hypothetical protein